MMKRIKNLLKASVFIFLCFAVMPLPVHAFDWEKLTFDGYILNESAYQTEESNKWFKCRNVLNLEFTYDFSPALRTFVQIRPIYDAAFDFGDRGIKGRKNMQKNWEDRASYDYDPLIREAWIEFASDKVEMRLGKQLVTWGTSDGFRLMDVVHSFNYRDLLKPADEDYKIPNWMVNLNYYFNPETGIQLLIVPRYIPSFSAPPVGHPWSFNVSGAIGNFIGAMAPLGVTFTDEEPATNWKNCTYGFRFRSRIESLDLDYTFNYLYTWDEFKVMVPDGPPIPGVGLPSAWKFRTDRLQIFGGTFSYRTTRLIPDTIIRGEFAYVKDDNFTNVNFVVEEQDHFDFLFGFDRYVGFFNFGPDKSDWWVSAQIKSSYLIDEGDYDYLNAGLAPIDRWETLWTLLITTDWYAEKLKLNLLFIGTDDGGLRTFPKFTWEFTNKLRATLGYYFIRGDRSDFLGEFHDNDTIEMVWKYSF
ncbi:MAG: hypothetical protein JRJ08_02395 [Deltaproteobacteria bacterium]|nr:hypothetical protein [Deltaproteobacteria bacterium]